MGENCLLKDEVKEVLKKVVFFPDVNLDFIFAEGIYDETFIFYTVVYDQLYVNYLRPVDYRSKHRLYKKVQFVKNLHIFAPVYFYFQFKIQHSNEQSKLANLKKF